MLLVVVTSNKGLCGAFNSNIIKEANARIKHYQQKAGVELSLITIGKRASEFFSKHTTLVKSTFDDVLDKPTFDNVAAIAEDIMKRFCDKEYEIAGVPITCIASHYTQSFEDALANSCNIAFAQLGVRLGQDTMVDYVRRYGFLDRQSLDGIPTVAGSFPTEFVGDPELGWASIGQSTDTVCPYSMLRLVCAIANGGTLVEPHMIQNGAEPARTLFMQPYTAEKLISMMNYNAVSHYNAEELFPGLKLCAKTGTAEIGNDLSHSWFVGFLADEEHPYAFVTLVERGGFGISTAGPIAAEVMLWAVDNIEP